MSKKHRLFILIGLLLISARIEWAKAYAVCRNEMLSFEGYGVWKYQKTVLDLDPSVRPKSGLVFVFDDGTNRAGCSAFRDQTGWHKNGDIFTTLVGCLPGTCSEGKFGVSP